MPDRQTQFTDDFVIGMRRALLALVRNSREVDIAYTLDDLNKAGEREAVRIIEMTQREVSRG